MGLLNGLSEMGKGIATFAGNAAVEQQKADLEQQQTILANQLREGSETRLAHVTGDESRQTAATSAEAQGSQQRETDKFKTTLPMTASEEAAAKAAQTHADAAMLDAKKPTPAGFGQGWLVPSKDDPSGYKVISVTGGNDLGPPDPTSDNLSKQIGLSEMGIHALTGDLTGRASIPYLSEAGNWAAKNNKNIDTIKAQAKALNETLKATSERNQLGVIQERELQGSVETIAPILTAMNAGTLNKANVLKIWGGGQVNDQEAMKAVDQLTRLKEELAGYNAIANAKITNGHPNPEKNEIDAANQVITNGLNNGSLKAFGESIASSAEKNRGILQKSVEDANTNLFSLFGGTYHKPTPVGGGTESPATTPAPVTGKPLPSAVDELLKKYGAPANGD